LDIKEKKINAVVVKRLDRLSRSLLDFEQFSNLCQENDVEFISLKESFDTTTAMGKAMLRIALVFAQLEREQTAERIADIMWFRAKKGLYNGGYRPLGYISIDNELTVQLNEKHIVENIFDKFFETRSIAEVVKFLNTNGYKDQRNNKFRPDKIKGILSNPVYLGKLKWRGMIYDGGHPAIMAEDQFQQVQEILNQ